MDQDGLPIVGTGINYSKVKPLDKKRLLAFVNHYVAHTVRFLNRFAGVCEEKMCAVESQLQRMETTMSILETKLSSIPGLDEIKVTTSTVATPPSSAETTIQNSEHADDMNPVPTEQQTSPTDDPVESVEIPPVENVKKVSQDSRYIKYFKMVAVGVPPPAIKMKMAAEGLNPDLLDTPDAAAPPDDTFAEQSSGSDPEPFSDSD